MNYVLISYISYLVVTVSLTVWVATTLFRNGKVFLLDIFHGNKELSDSVNNLLLVGFYLVNLGYAVYTLSVTEQITTARVLIEVLSLKIGWIILVLGAMHFLNLFIFFRLRSKAQRTLKAATTA